MEEAPPVRFRVVLQVTFPDADRNDPANYQGYLTAILEALRSAKNVDCADVVMRAASTIGPHEENGDWRGGPTFDSAC
jgi:hypothetical protein